MVLSWLLGNLPMCVCWVHYRFVEYYTPFAALPFLGPYSINSGCLGFSRLSDFVCSTEGRYRSLSFSCIMVFTSLTLTMIYSPGWDNESDHFFLCLPFLWHHWCPTSWNHCWVYIFPFFFLCVFKVKGKYHSYSLLLKTKRPIEFVLLKITEII